MQTLGIIMAGGIGMLAIAFASYYFERKSTRKQMGPSHTKPRKSKV
jgi:hypothetical protein